MLFEGYLLYPYRASAQKNRLRWQFGVLTPAGFPDRAGPHPHRVPARAPLRRACCTCGCGSCTCSARTVHDPDGRPVDALVDGDDRRFPCEEGVPREVDAVFPVDELGDAPAAS